MRKEMSCSHCFTIGAELVDRETGTYLCQKCKDIAYNKYLADTKQRGEEIDIKFNEWVRRNAFK